MDRPSPASGAGVHVFASTASRRIALRGIGAGGLAAVAAMLPGAAAWAQTPPSAPTGAASFLAGWANAWSARDAAVVAGFFAADAVFEDLAFELVARGQSTIQAADAEYMRAVPDLELPLVGGFASADGQWVAAEWRFAGTDRGGIIAGVPATGKRFDVRGASIFQMRDGKIQHETDYYNLATILRQLGLLPAIGRLATPPAIPAS